MRLDSPPGRFYNKNNYGARVLLSRQMGKRKRSGEAAMTYEDAGLSRVVTGLIKNVNRRWFHNYVQFFMRYSGFFVLGLIAYLHFIFQKINSQGLPVVIWMGAYFGILIT